MAEMLLAKDHDVIETVPPDRSDQPFEAFFRPMCFEPFAISRHT
jgi:hypothetical protein